ncbi:hypothetical protein P7C70_g7921, partial [Phenoliferia sp. Uapishka_3]
AAPLPPAPAAAQVEAPTSSSSQPAPSSQQPSPTPLQSNPTPALGSVGDTGKRPHVEDSAVPTSNIPKKRQTPNNCLTHRKEGEPAVVKKDCVPCQDKKKARAAATKLSKKKPVPASQPAGEQVQQERPQVIHPAGGSIPAAAVQHLPAELPVASFPPPSPPQTDPPNPLPTLLLHPPTPAAVLESLFQETNAMLIAAGLEPIIDEPSSSDSPPTSLSSQILPTSGDSTAILTTPALPVVTFPLDSALAGLIGGLGARGGTPEVPVADVQRMEEIQRRVPEGDLDEEDHGSDGDAELSEGEGEGEGGRKRHKEQFDENGNPVPLTAEELKKKLAYQKRHARDKLARKTWLHQKTIDVALRNYPPIISRKLSGDKKEREKQVKKSYRKERDDLPKIIRNLLTFGCLTGTSIMVLLSKPEPSTQTTIKNKCEDRVFTTPDLRSGHHRHLNKVVQETNQNWCSAFKKHRIAVVSSNVALREKNTNLQIAANKKEEEFKEQGRELEDERADNARLRADMLAMKEASAASEARMAAMMG